MITFVLLFAAVIFFLLYLNGIYNEHYWKKRKVAFYSKHKVTGIFWNFLFKNKSILENLCEVYKEFRNEPAVGIGAFMVPTLYVVHPTNVQHVLTTDFSSFNHRGFATNDNDLLADNILFMNGNRWKLMRQNMTPLFTSAKLKSMYYIIDKSAVDFVDHLKKNEALLKGNAFHTLSSFCCAAIGGAVFGVSTESIFDSPFLNMTQNAFKSNLITNLKFAVRTLSETVFKLLRIQMFKEHESFFIGAIKQVLRQREQDKTKRHDFADICVSLQSMGNMIDKDTGLELIPTDELLAAQAFFFFVAGVEPTANAIFSTLLELGRHPEHLQKVHNEIDESFKLNDNKMDYETVSNLEYLDMAFSEALRLHPSIGFLTRKCVKDTVLPVGNIKVDKGTKIWTPIFEIHHDERYYPEPEKFIPDRFSPQNRHNIADISYMPFGKGNRICIGARYASLQAKAGLVHLLRNFTVRTTIFHVGVKHSSRPVQVKLENVDIEFIPRNVIKS